MEESPLTPTMAHAAVSTTQLSHLHSPPPPLTHHTHAHSHPAFAPRAALTTASALPPAADLSPLSLPAASSGGARSTALPQREREMENRKEGQQWGAVGWMTVPAFAEWNMKNGAMPDYSMDFSKIREMRKRNKREFSRASLGGDDDLLAQQQKATGQAQAQVQPTKADFALTCSCCSVQTM